MPPKSKIDKQALLTAGIRLIQRDGYESLNARSLAKELNCSTHPIFRLYSDMEQIKTDLFAKAEETINCFLEKRMEDYTQNPMFALGMSYIDFAREETNLFQFLFMSHHFNRGQANLIWESEENKPLLQGIAQAVGISFEEAQSLLKKLWLLTHGLASMIAANGMLFTKQEITEILSEAFSAFLIQIKQGGN
ncbi:MAG: TetR/AcrR family transcriptional regulator [Erysipelotrichaceae bacterium]|nr:TetR/AcrR family transcriptional regulator [Erysipelotrichaceae bacterium]